MIWKLIRLLLLFIIGYYLYRALWKGEGLGFLFKRRRKSNTNRTPGSIEEMKKDPVCGVYIPENQAFKLKTDGNNVFFFCSETCKEKFQQLNK